MVDSIILIKGNVEYEITLDPSVWILDDRKVDLLTYFDTPVVTQDEQELYTKSVSKHWDREIQEGAVFPPTLQTERRYAREKLLTGTFAIPFHYFLENAVPAPTAKYVTIITEDLSPTIALEKANSALLGFSKNGKPLIVDGPVHLYYGDGSNKLNPITHIKQFVIE